MNRASKKRLGIGLILLVILAWVLALFFISPQEIVDAIGLTNAYLVVFIIAAIGGLSTLTGTSLFVAIATFAAGGANPWLLGLIGGLGIFISDSVFFLVARYGVQALSEESSTFQKRVTTWVERMPAWSVPAGVFFWVGMSPLPNDVLMIALALARIPYRAIVFALFCGSLSIATLTAHFGQSIPWLL